MLILLAMSAQAAEVTWMPDALEGAANIRYSGRYEFGGLEEQGERVSERRVTEHNMLFQLQFAPVRGLAAVVGLGATPSWRLAYPEARQMLREPVDGGGSYAFGSVDFAPEPTAVTGGGLDGVWLGVALAPFSESYGQNHRVSWRIDGAFRTGSQKNRWTVIESKRGASPGGTAFKVSGAFSRDSEAAEPYIKATYQREGKVTVDLTDETGTTWASGVELQPASRVEIVGGTEVIAARNESNSTAIDVFLGLGYRTWEDVPSGLYLPNVIDAARTIAVTRSEAPFGYGGLGLNIAFSPNIRSSAGARFEYTLPHTLEHVYDVQTTADTYGIGWYFNIIGVLGPDDLKAQ